MLIKDILDQFSDIVTFVEVTDDQATYVLGNKVAKNDFIVTSNFIYGHMLNTYLNLGKDAVTKLQEDNALLLKDTTLTNFDSVTNSSLKVLPFVADSVVQKLDSSKTVFYFNTSDKFSMLDMLQYITKGEYFALSDKETDKEIFQKIADITGDTFIEVNDDGNIEYVLTSRKLEGLKGSPIIKNLSVNYTFDRIKKAYDYLNGFNSVEDFRSYIKSVIENNLIGKYDYISVWVRDYFSDYFVLDIEFEQDNKWFVDTYKGVINGEQLDLILVEPVLVYREVNSKSTPEIVETETYFEYTIKQGSEDLLRVNVKGGIIGYFNNGELYKLQFSKADWDLGKITDFLNATDDLVSYIRSNIAFIKRDVRFIKIDNPDKRYILGIVLEPNDGANGSDLEPDLQGDVYSAEDIEKAAHNWMIKYRNMGLMHKDIVNDKIQPVESYIAPAEFTLGDYTIKKGTWLLGAKVEDEELWEQVKKGEFTGWSVGGYANRTEV